MCHLLASHHDQSQVVKDPEVQTDVYCWENKCTWTGLNMLVCPCRLLLYCYEDASHRISSYREQKKNARDL